MRRPLRRTASERSPSTSRFGPISTAFHGRPQVADASLLGHSANPSWCFEVSATYFAPDRANTSAQWSGSNNSALNCGAKYVALTDRKSTRLNSSHLGISYAVLCLKKKTNCSIQLE